MSLVKKLLTGWGMTSRKDRGAASAKGAGAAEHAVMVHLELVGGRFGSEDEVEEIRLLGDDCEEALRRAGSSVGTFEGEEFDDAECILYFAGPDAERLWSAIDPVVRSSRLARGGHVVQRFGAAGARESRTAI